MMAAEQGSPYSDWIRSAIAHDVATGMAIPPGGTELTVGGPGPQRVDLPQPPIDQLGRLS
jgi:hypothetical protein